MRPTLLPILPAFFLLSACGSDDDSPQVNEATVPLSDYGVIRVAHDTSTAQTQLDAVFCALEAPTAAATIDAQFLTGIDSCTVSNDGTATTANTDITAPLVCSTDLSAQSISAGPNLTLSSNTGTYADLARQVTGDAISYSTASPLPRPPNGLTLDIPGDTFPLFSAVPIPDLQEAVISSPATGEELRSDTAIRWTAATDNANSRLLLTASDADVTINCSLKDDGSFNFSTATQAELGELFSASSMSVQRQSLFSPNRGDSSVVIITSIK